MVARLWEAGRLDAALHLEKLWNELATQYRFSLLCAYKIRDFSNHKHVHHFEQICAAHTIATPAESALLPGTTLDSETARSLTMFQQKAYALETEVGRRQELERILRRREEELADFLENGVECLHQVGPDGTILWANKAELTMLGYQAEEYVGHSITQFHVDQPTIADVLQRLLRGETLYDYPARLRCKDGSIKEVLIHSNGRWEDGTFRYTRCFTRDITERKRFEQELDRRVEARTRELVLSQQKLRALAAELSLSERRVRKEISTELHDYLAQLLVVLRLKLVNATELAVEHPKLTQVLKEADEALDESIHYTRSLMADLHPSVLEWGLPLALRWLGEKFRKHHLTVEVDIAESLTVDLSENQVGLLFQSVRELLMNIVKHAQTDRARISLRLQGAELQLEVSDRGKGFGGVAIPLTVSTQPGMTQFGLFSIRERMEALGGQFDIHSSPNEGTRARLILPLTSSLSSNSSVSGAVNQVSHSATATLRVLLVEDHEMVRQGLRGVLESYSDIQVVAEAGNGEEAVTQAGTCSPDVVIMDINLPICDGIEATRRIKAQHPHIVVIGLSVHQTELMESALKDAGGSAYVTKESAVTCLYAAIQTAVVGAKELRI
jgi:PAS domain S-box-containing protein